MILSSLVCKSTSSCRLRFCSAIRPAAASATTKATIQNNGPAVASSCSICVKCTFATNIVKAISPSRAGEGSSLSRCGPLPDCLQTGSGCNRIGEGQVDNQHLLFMRASTLSLTSSILAGMPVSFSARARETSISFSMPSRFEVATPSLLALSLNSVCNFLS
jgi:hypothetical protein